MQIKIGENHRVITDPYNYILQEENTIEKGDNKGERVWRNVGYYSNFRQAIESYINKELKLSDAEGIEEVLNKLEQLEEDIQNLEVLR